MRVAIISDIHANLQAWQAVLQDIKQNNIDSIVCLGDIVGYGPRPKQVLEEVTYRTENIILGNHDAVIGNRLNPDEFNENAHEAIDWTRQCLGDDSAKFFGKVPTTLQFDDVLCVHAEAAEPENWNYITNPETALPSFLSTDASLIFMGHTHLPGVFSFDPATQQVTQAAPQDTFFNPHQRHLINVGSVGDPRDGDINACYTILDMESRHLSFRRVPFNYEAFRADQLSTGLKHKSWFLKLVDSQVQQQAAPMGDMTARPTSLVTGHINRRLPSVSLSPLVNTPTKLASAEKSQNRIAFFGVAAIVICFIGLAMIIASDSDEPPASTNDPFAVSEKESKKPKAPKKKTSPPSIPTPGNTPDKPDSPAIAEKSDPTPIIPEPPAPDPDPVPDPKEDPPVVAQADLINHLAEAFFARDVEKVTELSKQITPDASELKALTEKFINADKTILESYRPDLRKNVIITFDKGIKREVRIEKISDTKLTCSTVISGARAVREFTPADFDLRYRIARLAPEDDPIRYLYGGIEAAHAGLFSVTLVSFGKLDPELRIALKEALVKHVVATGHLELEVLLDGFSIPTVKGDLEKTIDDIWSSSVDLESTQSLAEKIELIRKKLAAVEAESHPFYLQLGELQEAFTLGYRRGLIAEFYANREHQGQPLVTRIDPTINFKWGEEAPAPEVEKDSFSTTWTGFIRPVESGTHGFSISVDDKGSVEFVKSETSEIEGTYVESFELELQAGVYYSFVFKHIEGWGNADASFSWKTPSENSFSIVPKEVLFHIPPAE